MPATWEKAEQQVVKMAQEVIREHHTHLLDAQIGFLFRSEPGTSKGRKIKGKAKKISDRMKTYLELDFMIWISEPDWRAYEPSQRRALLDHLLCHCQGTEWDGWKVVGPEIATFAAVIRRHGLWDSTLYQVGKAIQQHLPGLEGEREPKGGVSALDPESEELQGELA